MQHAFCHALFYIVFWHRRPEREDSRFLLRTSPFCRAVAGDGKFRRRIFKASAQIFSSRGAGSVALRLERDDCRILEKISPFAWCRECGVAAGKRRLQDFEKISPFARRRERGAAAGRRKLQDFWRKFLPLPGAGSMAPLTGRRKFQHFAENFSPVRPVVVGCAAASEQIKFIREINFLSHNQLVLRPCHVIENEFKKQGAAQTGGLLS